MEGNLRIRLSLVVTLVLLLASVCFGQRKVKWPFIPEECSVRVRDPSVLCKARIPDTLPPTTVYDEEESRDPLPISLDEAIRVGLQNSEVVRVLAGVAASSSGSTIYDVSVAATGIEEAKARFDPIVQALNSFNRNDSPSAIFNPLDPTRALITGSRSDNYTLDFDVTKDTVLGGTARVGVNNSTTRFNDGPLPLNPSGRTTVDMSYTQPLLQGGGYPVNQVPIVLARIDTERSYFRLKNSVQNHVNGVIQGYWALVQARVDLWARQQQEQQTKQAFDRAKVRFKTGLTNQAEVAQTELALENFRVSLIAAEADLLLRETALRNILGFQPNDGQFLVPTTPPSNDEIRPEWEQIVTLAEQHRPDIIELKLILDADRQLLLQANNQAQARLDAVGVYRWNGLEGEMPIGERLASNPGQFNDWTLAVNFSVPLGLRASRAGLRRRELIITRDRANLDQGMHQVVHGLTINVRNLAQFYRQYERLKFARAAAKRNLDQQIVEYEKERAIFLNVLQAISDWGNAVSAEARSLIQYNIELANLELATGTILETHGVRFFEERYCSLGPLGKHHAGRTYPRAHRPGENFERYYSTNEPAEEAFDLTPPRANTPSAPRRGGAPNEPAAPEPRDEILPISNPRNQRLDISTRAARKPIRSIDYSRL